jgi:hypothetical protein
MPEVLVENRALREEGSKGPETNCASSRGQSSSFKYYIHDSVSTLRFQLIGDLQATNVTELNGSWETARTTLARRRLVLDVRQLRSADAAGDRWLFGMNETGAAFLPARHFVSDVHSIAARLSEEATDVKLSLLARILGMFGVDRAADLRSKPKL